MRLSLSLLLAVLQLAWAPVPRCGPFIFINKLPESTSLLSDFNPYFPVPPCEYGGPLQALRALYWAVVQEELEKARSILEHQTHINVNFVYSDGFTLLDLAFMTANQALVSLVVHHGGKEGASFPSPEAVSAYLLGLITESSKQVEKFYQLVNQTASWAGRTGALSQVQLKDSEMKLRLWQWQKRLTTLKKLKAGFDGAGCPLAPVEVAASVTGSSCINVKVKQPEKTGNSIFTKVKVQWSLQDTFSEVKGEMEFTTIDTLEYNIENLSEGKRYFIRASFGNPKGYGPFSDSRPRSLVCQGVGQQAKVWLYAKNVSGFRAVTISLKHWAVVVQYLEEGQVDRQELYHVEQNKDGIAVASHMTFSSRLDLEWMKKSGAEKRYLGDRTVNQQAVIAFCHSVTSKKEKYHILNNNCHTFVKDFESLLDGGELALPPGVKDTYIGRSGNMFM